VNINKAKAIDLAIRMARDTKKSHVVRNVGGFGQPKYIVIAKDADDRLGSLVMSAEWKEP
jgi:hypothetical protein